MNDDTIRIGEKFQKLIEEFSKKFKGDVVQIRYEGDDDLVQAELMAFTIKSSACAFDICLAENDEEDTVEADKIIVEDNYQTFTNFVNRVNACIAQFDQELRDKTALVYHELYRIWIPARIVDLMITDCFSYQVHYTEEYPTGHTLLPYYVRTMGQRCQECGNQVPFDYMAEHQDPAIHIAYKLTKVYLSFWKHFKGHDAVVENRPVKLVDIYQPPELLSFTYRLTFMDNNTEGNENSQNIEFNRKKCILCGEWVQHAAVMDHLDEHMYEPGDSDDSLYSEVIDEHEWTQTSLEIFEETFVNPIFAEFSRKLQDTSAVVRTETDRDWRLVQLISLRVADNGNVFYLVQYSDRNQFTNPRGNEWIPAQNIRCNYFECPMCPPFTYVSSIEHTHDTIHLPPMDF